MDVPQPRWDWFIDRTSDLVEDTDTALRIQVYCEIMRVWWVARLARYLYELPRDRDQRLAAWPPGWQADIEAKYKHYLALAEAA